MPIMTCFSMQDLHRRICDGTSLDMLLVLLLCMVCMYLLKLQIDYCMHASFKVQFTCAIDQKCLTSTRLIAALPLGARSFLHRAVASCADVQRSQRASERLVVLRLVSRHLCRRSLVSALGEPAN